MKNILYRIRQTLVVSKCPSCGVVVRREGTLCPECLGKYGKELVSPCKFCALPASSCVCNTRNLIFCRALGLSSRSLFFYEAENAVFMSALKKLKYSTDRGAEKLFARELSRELLRIFTERGEIASEWKITYPPRRRDAQRLYGFDQAKGLAKRIARYTGAEFCTALKRRGGAPQKTLGAEERAKNAKESFEIASPAEKLAGKFVIVDDIVTSGATALACQELLLSHGASAAFVLSAAKTPSRGAGYEAKRRFINKKGKSWFSD